MTEAFGGKSKDEATEIILNVLRALAYPEDFRQPSAQDRKQASQFFEHVLQRLQPA